MPYTRRRFLERTLVGALAGTAASSGPVRGAPAPPVEMRPNVILLITDDQGYGDLGCHGNTVLQTPNLDRLHAESVRLTNFHVDPTCSPTRSALMTGRYSHRVGVWHTIMGRSFLRADETTMADVFRASGYRTGLFGKWHLGGNYPLRPIDRGFDQWVGHGHGGTGCVSDFWGNDKMNDTYLRNGRWEKFSGFCTDIYFDEAMRFIAGCGGRPFFVYLATNVPHDPWNLPAEWAKPYLDRGVPAPRAYFYGSVARVDHNLGRLRDFLRTRGLAENTIIIFLTDNGTSGGCQVGRGEFVTAGYNAGMRGRKGSIYDGGHRVPCFVHWPRGGLAAGADLRMPAAHLDLLPTLIDLCGLKAPDGVAFDGKSLAGRLTAPHTSWPERRLIVESQRIRDPEKWRQSAVMTDRWRLVNGRELYDITADPGQENDVAAQHGEVVEELRRAYEAWWADVSARDDEWVRPAIGAVQQEVVCLTSDDWVPTEGTVPWDQDRHILEGPQANGFWPVEVARRGTFEFSLRRWPAEVDRPIRAGLPVPEPGDVTTGTSDGQVVPVRMRPGRAVPATRARLEVADARLEQEISEDAREVVFRVPREAGPTRVQTWLIDEKSGESRGAYYVYVRRMAGE